MVLELPSKFYSSVCLNWFVINIMPHILLYPAAIETIPPRPAPRRWGGTGCRDAVQNSPVIAAEKTS
ncbi:hypothetical protein E2C01_003305 [Portunus trituberculatus]|uniref:Uncharacterized protein n=1 Tax=Portunus trituberculatus TaxID=210409 RepID=A0A5B7CQR1_PORTR|nr:hypothetical protein [Portunus trituberculatus]